MNLPNKLTLMRVFLVPVFLFFVLCDFIPYNLIWALVVFIIASITDALDGHIARKNNLVTNFGKFLDPLADKVLVISALIMFIELGFSPAVPIIIIIAREFMVSGLRMLASQNVVIAAAFMGKLKTAFTMVAIVAILLLEGIGIDMAWLNQTLIWVATALTVISGVQYLVAYKDIIDPSK